MGVCIKEQKIFILSFLLTIPSMCSLIFIFRSVCVSWVYLTFTPVVTLTMKRNLNLAEAAKNEPEISLFVFLFCFF